MQRQTFLKNAVALAVAAHLPFAWTAAAATAKPTSYGGKLYRAGGNGQILVSTDRGATWTLHSDLGDIYAVTRLAVDRKRLSATVAFAGRTFGLFLAPDGKQWLTS